MTIQTKEITAKNQLSNSPQLSDDPRSLLDDDLLNRHRLKSDQYVILNELLKLRTATLSRFEIETNRLGQGIDRELDALEAAGWIESQPTGSLLEPKVYYLSAKAIKLLLFSENN